MVTKMSETGLKEVVRQKYGQAALQAPQMKAFVVASANLHWNRAVIR